MDWFGTADIEKAYADGQITREKFRELMLERGLSEAEIDDIADLIDEVAQ